MTCTTRRIVCSVGVAHVAETERALAACDIPANRRLPSASVTMNRKGLTFAVREPRRLTLAAGK